MFCVSSPICRSTLVYNKAHRIFHRTFLFHRFSLYSTSLQNNSWSVVYYPDLFYAKLIELVVKLPDVSVLEFTKNIENGRYVHEQVGTPYIRSME